ncbi:MAG: hypothetical protein LBQ66_02210 [Planctomycetaceae bacterium]|nr:hypothetical protein [Planctomycetaceae bacterium]
MRRRYSPRKPGGRLPTLRLPTRFGVPFKLVRSYYAQRRAGRPRSSPSPLRGELVWYNESGCPRSSPRRFAAIVGYSDG